MHVINSLRSFYRFSIIQKVETSWTKGEMDAFILYSASSYPFKMPRLMSCNIWQNDLNLKGRHWCQQQVNTKLQMRIDCLDAPVTPRQQRQLLFTSQISQNVEVALKSYWRIAKVSALNGRVNNKSYTSS